MSSSAQSIFGPFSLLSETFAGRFDAGMRISGAKDGGTFVVVDVDSGLTEGGTTVVMVRLVIAWFTLVVLRGVAIFSLIVDSPVTRRREEETRKREIRFMHVR